MSVSRRSRWLPAVPIVAASAVAVIGLMLVTAPGLRANPDIPRATAGYQTVNDLILAVDVPALKEGTRPALSIELLDRSGKVMDKQTPDLPGKDETSLRVAFKRPTEKLGNIKVRLTSGSKVTVVSMEQILLSKAHETTLAASSEMYAGSEAGIRCAVAGVKSVTESVPLASDVIVRLHQDAKTVKTLYTGKTGSDGIADVRFRVPELPAGTYKVEVLTKSALGEEKLERDIKVVSAPKILLTTDKPLYQPGQTMHLRALSLRAFDLAPAGKADVLLEIEDGKGNKVFKRTLTTSEYGIAQADFTLADEVNMGDYRIRAIQGDVTSEKTVAVKRYVLPKFKAEVKSDKTYYLPKETIKGTLQVDYFFGKPVAGGTVEVKASTFDVAFKEFTTWKGKTDKDGHVKYEVKLPDYFVGTPLAKGNAIVKLDVKVTDTADHSESITRTYPVSDQPIRVSLIPEAGRLIPGIENRIFASALYPDGTPAQATVDFYLGNQAKGKAVATVKTNEAGLAELKLTPKVEQFRTGNWGQVNIEMLGGTQQRWMPTNLFDIAAEARDSKGNKASRVESLTSEPLGENVLMRLDKAIYKGGDSLNVDVHTSAGTPTVYLDIVKSGQVMMTRWLDVKNSKASVKVDLPATVFGTLDVHAYTVLTSGEIVRDSRVVYVSPADELKIKVTADRDVYLPGQNGKVNFEVTDKAGKPMPTALGVLIVDEAVYALQDMQPGLEKVYFTLQEELLKPKVQINYTPREGVDQLINQPVLNDERQQVAQVLFTAVKPKLPARWEVNPAHVRRNKAREAVAAIGQQVFLRGWNDKLVLVKDAKSGEWAFNPDLLTDLVKAGVLTSKQLDDQAGGRFTLKSLAKLESGFAPEQMGRKITQARMTDMLWAVVMHTNTNQNAWLKNGKWTLPKTLLVDAVKRHNPNVAYALKDAWGKEIEVRARAKDDKDNVGSEFFKAYTIVSAGPDGKFGTKDDVVYTPMNERWMITNVWWMNEGKLTTFDQLARRELRDGLVDRFAVGGMMGGMPGGGGMGFGGGKGTGGPPPGPVPMAARPVDMDRPKLADLLSGDDKKDGGAGSGSGSEGAPAMRLREYFPETLLWQPSLITDDRGRATLDIPFADSITTWRLTASGSSRTGALGGVTAPLRVFQDFFVDLDLPVALTQNDEVAFPVAVYNYLKTPQTVTLELKQNDAFTLVEGDYKRSLDLKSGEVTAIKFRIKAKKVGMMPLQVDARGSKMSDAIKRLIEVLPDGKPIEQVFTDRLKGTVTHKLTVPDNAIDGASRLFVKVYPGVMSQVMEGMEGMLRLPGG